MSDLAEPPGTILVGSANKRAYLFISQSTERMAVERANAAQFGVQDMRDFVFVLDGQKFELSFDELKARLRNGDKQQMEDDPTPDPIDAAIRSRPQG